MRAGRTRKKIADDTVNMRLNICNFWLKMFHQKKAKRICSEQIKSGKKRANFVHRMKTKKKSRHNGYFWKGNNDAGWKMLVSISFATTILLRLMMDFPIR